MTVKQGITEQEVIDTYKELLGREPESPEAVKFNMSQPSVNSLKAMIMFSEEYKAKQKRVKGDVIESVHNVSVPVDVDYENRWLVVANCQTNGLVSCLSLLCSDQDIEPCHLQKFESNFDWWKKNLHKYKHIIMLDDVARRVGASELEKYSNITWIPSMEFGAFQPDQGYVGHKGEHVKGALDEYHSIIAFAAYKSGLTVEQTKELYCDQTYQALGYYDLWDAEKARLIQRFKRHGIDIQEAFQRWVRKGAFMYGMNHPNIHVLHDIAELIACKLNWSTYKSPIRPQDVLANSAQFPVYPEIAERLGLEEGALLFKKVGIDKFLTLDELIKRSFDAFRQYDKDALEPLYYTKPYFDAAMKLIAGKK